MEQLEEEKAKKKREVEIKEKNEMLRREKAKHQQEFIHKSEKLENNLIIGKVINVIPTFKNEELVVENI